jgi:hypothetical protein
MDILLKLRWINMLFYPLKNRIVSNDESSISIVIKILKYIIVMISKIMY